MTYLDEILQARRAAVERKKAERPIRSLLPAALDADRRDFARALTTVARPAIIAEFKRSSPSAGAIARDADPGEVAAAYERAGAAALSVLTEPDRFGGSFADLRAARAATALPVLCKDFVVDGYQVTEAAAEGADAILLIAAALDGSALRDLIVLAHEFGMSAIVEVHDEDELAVAAGAGALIIGANNRDLRTFAVDTATADRLRLAWPPGVISVAESGYRTPRDLERCAAAGFDAVLIGEALMREADPGAALAEFTAMRR